MKVCLIFDGMRYTLVEIEGFRNVIREFLPHAEIRLFGSRIDDSRKGGDIDILVIADRRVSLEERMRILIRLKELVGDQRIDLLIQRAGKLDAFAETIKDTSVAI